MSYVFFSLEMLSFLMMLFFFVKAVFVWACEVYASNQKAAAEVAKRHCEAEAASKGKPVKMPKQETWPYRPSARLYKLIFATVAFWISGIAFAMAL